MKPWRLDAGAGRGRPAVNSGPAANTMLAGATWWPQPMRRHYRGIGRVLLECGKQAALAISNAPATERGGLHDVDELLSQHGDRRARAAGPACGRPAGIGAERS